MSDGSIIINIDDDADEGRPAGSSRKPRADVEAAEAEAHRARADEARMKAHLIEVEKGRLQSHLNRIDAQSAAAESEFYVAAEDANFAAQSAAQRQIADKAAERKAFEAEYRRVASIRPPAADPVEAFIATRDADTQAWLRAHPDETRALILEPNSRRAKKINAAHNDAMAEGHREGSDAYFGHIEKFAGVSRSGGSRERSSAMSSGSSGGTEVTLTKGEATAAADGTHVWGRHDLAAGRCKPHQIGEPIGNVEMARRKLTMQRQGLYDR